MQTWCCGTRTFILGKKLQPLIMGIVNATPDSFSDGGKYDPIAHAMKLVEQGADIIDVGGESTRPGAATVPVPVDEELRRIVPVVRYLAKQGVAVSIDTYKPQVMAAALDAGACIINDVNALQEIETSIDEMTPNILAHIIKSDCGIVLMHKQGQPASMQTAPQYQNDDVVGEVNEFLQARCEILSHAGIDKAGINLGRILIDPGIGFGKTQAHNIELIQSITVLQEIAPVLMGVSRKSVVGYLLGDMAADREAASIQLAVYCAAQGAAVLRVHDVAGTRAALAAHNPAPHHHHHQTNTPASAAPNTAAPANPPNLGDFH